MGIAKTFATPLRKQVDIVFLNEIDKVLPIARIGTDVNVRIGREKT